MSSRTVVSRGSHPVGGADDSEPAVVPTPPWWLWPHLLSLDAPLVAVVWQRWWARAAGVRLSWVHVVLLGGGVWLIYLADRLADTTDPTRADHDSTRHAFYRRHRRVIGRVVTVVFIGLAGLAPAFLTTSELTGGLGLLALAGGYFWWVHGRARGDWGCLAPKEAIVGGMFVAGTAFFVRGGGGVLAWEWGSALAMFGGLCFFNCALITKWERNPLDLHDASSLFNAFPRLTARLGAGCLGLAALASVATVAAPHGRVFAPLMLGALLLAGLDARRDLFSTDALRLLADVVLLTPWIFGSGLL